MSIAPTRMALSGVRSTSIGDAIALGMPGELLDRMYETSSELKQLLTGYERWSPVTRLGWAITGVANPTTYDRAVQHLENGQPDAAEDVLEEYWNQEGRLETVFASKVTFWCKRTREGES